MEIKTNLKEFALCDIQNRDAINDSARNTNQDYMADNEFEVEVDMFDKVRMEKEEAECEDDIRQSGGIKKSIVERYFSPIRQGSLRSSIFAMTSICLGMGVLGLPAILPKISFTLGIILTFLGGFVGYWSLAILATTTAKIKSESYSESVRKSFGSFASKFLDGIIIFHIFGTLVGSIVITFHLIGLCYFDLIKTGYNKFEDFDKEVFSSPLVSYLLGLGNIVICLPLCLLKDISKMSLANIVSIIALLYGIIVIVIECPYYWIHFKDKYPNLEINWIDMSSGFNKELDFFTGVATFLFSFACHSAAIPVYKTLNNNIMRRVKKVFKRSVYLNTALYLIVSICGFLTVPVKPPDIIIYREKITENDFAMIIARLAMAISLILGLPSSYNGLRLSMLEMFFKTSKVSTKHNLILTIPVLILATLIAINFKNIITYFAVLGGFCVVIICFIFPGLLYIKNNDYPLSHWKNIGSLLIMVIITICGFTAGIKAIIDIFR